MIFHALFFWEEFTKCENTFRRKDAAYFSTLKLRVFMPGNAESRRTVLKAPAGEGFSESGIEKILLQQADKIEQQFPGQEYRLVPLGANSFNFVWVCRKPSDADLGISDSSAPQIAAPESVEQPAEEVHTTA